MRYYKLIEDGYIIAIGTGAGGTEITNEEYENILTVIRSQPAPSDGKGYKLTESLEWEEYELPIVDVDEDPELTDEEALDIILGGAI